MTDKSTREITRSSRKVVFILIPIITFTLALAGTLFYYIYKKNITQTVYRDLETMVSICKIYTDELFDTGMERPLVLRNLESAFDKIVIGDDGFLFVVDPRGNLLVHQRIGKKNWIEKPHIQYIVSKRKGLHRFLSPQTKTFKISAFDYVRKGEFIIVATAFEEDFFKKPMQEIVTYLMITFGVVFILGIAVFTFVLREEQE